MTIPICGGGGGGDREIVFFDVETTVPIRAGQRFWVLEFGAILVCPRKLVELESYCTLIRPGDLSAVPPASGRPDGITRGTVAAAPPFEDVADRIFGILNGRIWAGHNIRRFDCARIREAFADVGRPAPEPIGLIDSLAVLADKFGKRAGNLKMSTLAAYFGLGQQKHRSLADARMNLEVVKHCATILFLESSLPHGLNGKGSKGSSTMTTRSKTNKRMTEEERTKKSPPILPLNQRTLPCGEGSLGKVKCNSPPSMSDSSLKETSNGYNLKKNFSNHTTPCLASRLVWLVGRRTWTSSRRSLFQILKAAWICSNI